MSADEDTTAPVMADSDATEVPQDAKLARRLSWKDQVDELVAKECDKEYKDVISTVILQNFDSNSFIQHWFQDKKELDRHHFMLHVISVDDKRSLSEIVFSSHRSQRAYPIFKTYNISERLLEVDVHIYAIDLTNPDDVALYDTDLLKRMKERVTKTL